MIAVTINPADGANSTGNDFVDEPSRTISGVVLEDTDNNNSGDTPIPVVTLNVVDSSGVTVATVVTDTNGEFTVDVPPGTYTVVQENNPGFDDVSDSDGGDPNVITVDVGTGDSTDSVFVDERPSSAPSVSASPTTRTAPSSFPSTSSGPSSAPSGVQLGSISGNVSGDTDNNDAGDVNLNDVPIKLLDSSGGLVATTATDANGNYVFYDVPFGTYAVMETNIASFPFDVSDNDGGDLNMIAVTINPAYGANSTGNDFVDEPSRTISGCLLYTSPSPRD